MWNTTREHCEERLDYYLSQETWNYLSRETWKKGKESTPSSRSCWYNWWQHKMGREEAEERIIIKSAFATLDPLLLDSSIHSFDQ